MKRKPRSNFWIALTAGFLLFFTPHRTSAADFDVNVPFRAGAGVKQIARMKITLTMANALNPTVTTEQLSLLNAPGGSVLGSRTMTASTVGAATISGFRVQFYSLASAPNVAVIDITFQNKFDPVGTYCNVVGTFPFNVALRYNPAAGNTILEYRISSYSAPGSATAEQCGCPNRRVNVNPIAWGSTPPGTDRGRNAYDVVLVLDRSGSMGDLVPVGLPGSTGTEVKMAVLKEAVSQFIDSWRGEPDAPGNDRLAIIGFDSSVSVLPPGTFVPRDPASGWNDLKAAVVSPAFSPGSSTALGDGISRAVEMIRLSGNDATIVVMTNGMQNDGNQILVRPAVHATLQSYFDINSSSFQVITAPCVPMQCIGIGAPASAQMVLLNAVSSQTGGLADQTVNAVGLAAAFGNMLVEILKGNTMSLHTRSLGTLTAGTPQVSPATTFNLDSSVRQATVVLGWLGSGNQNALKLQLFAPGSTTPVFKTQVNEARYAIQTIELPTNGIPGVWRAEVSRNSGNADVPFYLSIYTFEGRFSSRLDFKATRHAPGDDIILTAALGFAGQPLLGQANGLKVQVERPPSGLSNALHQIDVPPSVLTAAPSSTNPGISTDSYTSHYERKLFHLFQTTSLGQQIEPKPEPQLLTLVDDGNAANGDATANDGIYSARYTQTRVPGRYRFKVTMNVNTPTGAVNRVEQRDVEVKVLKIDPSQAEVSASHDPGSGNFRIDIVPADRFGNFLGPGESDQIVVTLSGTGTVSPVVDERENGTYTVHLTGVTDPKTTRIKASYRGESFADLTVDDALKPTRRFAVFGGIGGNFPHGDFNTAFDSGISTQLGFEYRFTNRFSGEGTFGYDRFRFSPVFPGDLNLYRGSANAKFYPVIGTFQFGVVGGGGVYHFQFGGAGSTRGGINFGAVSEFRINTSWSIEGTYNFHNVFTSGTDTRFSTVQGGVRFRF